VNERGELARNRLVRGFTVLVYHVPGGLDNDLALLLYWRFGLVRLYFL